MTNSKAERIPVGVKATYFIKTSPSTNESYEIQLDIPNAKPGHVGLAANSKASKPKPGDYEYSGVHDQGPLPELQQHGDLVLLISSVQRLKEASDEYLTKVIDHEKQSSAVLDQEKPTKKTKI